VSFYRENEAEWLTAFLTVRAPSDRHLSWFSAFSAIVRDAREATGRDLDTGEVENEARAGNWLGTLGYLVLLDQVGGCFEPAFGPQREPANRTAFVKALTLFTPRLSDDDILALYALRCAFAHEYALTNYRRNQPRLTHRFLLRDEDSAAPVVEHPQMPWHGSYSYPSSPTRRRSTFAGSATSPSMSSRRCTR
jgi:hypothetical protein